MRTGMVTSVPAGSPFWFLLDAEPVENGDGLGARLELLAAAGYGNTWWAIVVDGLIQRIVYLTEGVTRFVSVLFDPSKTQHAISAVCQGQWDSKITLNAILQQQDFEVDKGYSVRVDWDAVIEELEAWGDSGQLSAWSLSGLRRYDNVESIPDQPSRGRLEIVLSDSGGNRTVTLRLQNGFKIAEGTRAGDGVVTLLEQNNSGVSGTVTVTYSGDLAAGTAFLAIRWAAKYEIDVDSVLNKTVLSTERLNHLSALVGPLSSGSRDFQVRAISDTGINGTMSGIVSKTVPGRPEPPGIVSDISGDWTNTVIQFQASATAGATYRIYDSALDSPTDLSTIAATRSAGTGVLTVTLPSLPAAAAGKRRVIVVAVNAGIEDGLRRRVVIEYDAAGARIAPRPNIPGFAFSSISGKTLTLDWTYDSAEEKTVGAAIQLFLIAEGGTVDFNTPDATQAIPASGTIKRGTISATVLSNGWYKFICRAADAAGVQSENTAQGGPRYISDSVPQTPANISVEVIA